MQHRLFRRSQRFYEGVIFFFRQRTIHVIARAFIVPVLRERAGIIDRIRRNHGRGSVEKVQISARFLFDVRRQGVRSQRPRGDNRVFVARNFGNFYDFFRYHADVFFAADFFRNVRREFFPVHGKRAARGHGGVRRRFHRKRAENAHFFLQKSARVRVNVGGFQ